MTLKHNESAGAQSRMGPYEETQKKKNAAESPHPGYLNSRVFIVPRAWRSGWTQAGSSFSTWVGSSFGGDGGCSPPVALMIVSSSCSLSWRSSPMAPSHYQSLNNNFSPASSCGGALYPVTKLAHFSVRILLSLLSFGHFVCFDFMLFWI